MFRRRAVVYGAGGHARSVAEAIEASGSEVVAFVSDDMAGGELLGRPVVASIGQTTTDVDVYLAVGDNFTRSVIWRDNADLLKLALVSPLIHPSASVSAYATLGSGSVVLQGAIIASGAQVGLGCVVNSGAILDHQSVMQDFSSLAPGATVGGQASIGRCSAVGIGASVKHGVMIGANTVLGAASYAHRDIPGGVVAYGVPARVIRHREESHQYLT